MKKSVLAYLVFKNIVHLLLCIAGGVLTGFILVKIFDNSLLMIEGFLLTFCLPATGLQRSVIGYEGLEQFQTFQFCRKQHYQYEVIICIVGATVLALARAIYQSICYKEIVRYITEDTVITEYHQVPFFELFISSACIFMAMNLTKLILDTMSIHFFPYYAKGESLQLKQRVQERKEQSSLKWKIITPISIVAVWIAWFVVLFGMLAYYELQIQVDLPIRIGVIMVLLVVCVILYLIGKKRYRPEYI